MLLDKALEAVRNNESKIKRWFFIGVIVVAVPLVVWAIMQRTRRIRALRSEVEAYKQKAQEIEARAAAEQSKAAIELLRREAQFHYARAVSRLDEAEGLEEANDLAQKQVAAARDWRELERLAQPKPGEGPTEADGGKAAEKAEGTKP